MPQIRKLTEVLESRRLTLLGHVIRAGPHDPLFQATFEDQSLESYIPAYRRVGHPRQAWLDRRMENAWEQITVDPSHPQHGTQYNNTVSQRGIIKAQASKQKPPFNTKRKRQT